MTSQLQIDQMYSRALYNNCTRLLVCGTRYFPRSKMHLIREELELVPKGCTIIHGGNGTRGGDEIVIFGADLLADEVARELGLSVITYHAKWRTHGAAAGPIRNSEMIRSGPDLVLAFWDGYSKGTLDTLKKARQAGIPTRVVEYT